MNKQQFTPVGAPFFHYYNNELYVEQVSILALAKQFGTPLYIYSKAALYKAWQRYIQAAAQHSLLICYGMKANSNLAVLNLFAHWGSGFDIVSGGELKRCLTAGAKAEKIIFSGVGKQVWEIELALRTGIKCFNVESIAELYMLNQVAQRLGLKAPVSLRINPDVDAKTHPYISTGLKESKFGISMQQALSAYQTAIAMEHINCIGLDCHIGSQITELSTYFDAIDRLLCLLQTLKQGGISLKHIDLGGGLGITYSNEQAPEPVNLVNGVFKKLQAAGFGELTLILEPGRSLVGNAGILLTQVIYLKHSELHNFAIVDAAMNDLLRPSLYHAYHGLLAITPKAEDMAKNYDIVGPVCESSDWLAKNRLIAVEQGDYLALESAGAYGAVMASQYNTRGRAAEVIVDGDQYYQVRRCEMPEEIYELDRVLPTNVVDPPK